MTHPCLPPITRALDELYLALGELRDGPHEYRSERSQIEEVIRTIAAIAKDVRTLDYDLSPEGCEETEAWRRQTRPYAGGWAVWGG
ncbi:MAG: hypothetical protein EBR82_51175 [Caulobacteraceae bacterium]|nr:hypothetical protein [Caulobacteraceae bacterium]